MKAIIRRLIHTAVAMLATLSAFGHCDAVNGPVVNDARIAIESGDVEPVLKWIEPRDEEAIRSAFDRTLAVRGAGEGAQELADQWFFETVVRIHRASEGAPYTGLRPATYDPGVALRLGDESLVSGSVDVLEEKIVEGVRHGIRERFARAREAYEVRSESVGKGREFVASYVEFMHYVDRLHRDARADAISHGRGEPEVSHDH